MQRPALTPDRTLRIALFAGLGYGLLNGMAAVYNGSLWFATVGCYYLLMSLTRLLLLRNGADAVRKCGWLLLLITAVIGGMSWYALELGRASVYPGHLIYGAATYTFYALTMATVQLVRWHRKKQPVWWAAKVISLTGAAVSLFFLENALLAAFGSGDPWQYPMQLATAGGVFLFSAAMAIWMIIKKDAA